MDESQPSFPQHDPCGRIDADAVPVAAGVQPPTEPDDKLAALQRESTTIVYCGSAQVVSEGFAIALRAMGVDTDFLPVHLALPTENSNRKDN